MCLSETLAPEGTRLFGNPSGPVTKFCMKAMERYSVF